MLSWFDESLYRFGAVPPLRGKRVAHIGPSDRFDSFVLCELARTDNHRFRMLEPDSDETKAVRPLTRAREDLVSARVSLGHQLRAELDRFWPAAVGLVSAIDSLVALRS